MIWRLYITVVALRQVHRVSTGKALAVMALPLVLSCGLLAFGLFVLLAAVGAGAA